ncbi:translocation/assembly module TamB domain-containing protein [Natronospira bacteriovora]|uniref:Translocation/assembly module TamB domain-containing protein n=1 Tax=Natronospira bacteriovora TaxID=3069753 RepID=A0ABU0W6P6_9GAMM|nr:translocation/assembly module TamB domain-containing protein [Natronospira sp. AB-CW4]MDQ2069699.1 translocation/assembly module TamB domain-containing protein [Natronospira sp. AB-CW4]
MSEQRRKAIGWRGWLVIGSTGLLTAVILALVALLYTEAGLRWAVSQASQFSPGELEIGEIQGSLGGPLRLGDILYREEGLEIEAAELRADWRLGLLLLRTLHVDQLHVEGLRLRLSPDPDATADDEPFRLPEAIELPLRINLTELLLRDARLFVDDELQFELRQLRLDALARGKRLRIDELDLDSPLLLARLEGELEMAGDWPLQLDSDWLLRLPDLPQVEGATRLEGDLQHLRLQQQISRPLVADVSGDIRQALEAPRVQLALRFRELRPSRFLDEAPEGLLAGQFQLSGPLDDLRLRGHVDATDTPWGDLGLRGDVNLPTDLTWLQLRSLQLDHQQHPMRIRAQGRVENPLEDDPLVDLALEWVSLAWPLDIPEYVSEAGELRLQGRQSDYRLELATRFAWLGHHPDIAGPLSGEIHAGLQGGPERADIDDLLLRLDDGAELGFGGAVDWSDRGSFVDGDFRIARLDPGRLAPDWPGELAASGQLLFSWRDGEPRLDLTLAEARGQLLEHPLEGRGRLAYGDEQLEFDDFRLRLGDSQLQADGRLARERESAIRFHLAVEELADWPIDAAGRLTASGALAGTLDALDLELEVEGANLAQESLRLREMALNIKLRDSGRGQSRAELLAEGIEYDDQLVERIHVALDGQQDSHRLLMTVEQELIHFGLSLAGGLDADFRWEGELLDTRLSNALVGDWQQQEASRLVAGPDGGRLDQTCLRTPEHQGSLCFAGDGDAEGHWQADIRARDFPLAMLVNPEAMGVDVTGLFDLGARAHDRGDGIRAEGELEFSPGAIRQAVDGEAMTLMAIDGGRGRFNWTPDSADGDIALDLSDGGHFRLWAELPDGMDGPLQGRLDADIPQLGLLPVLVAEVGRAEGRLTLAVDIDGQLDDPSFTGDVRVHDAILSLPDLGITAEAVNVHVTGGMQTVSMTASAQSGGGQLEFDADLDRLAGDWQGGARLRGEDFLALSTPDARIRINPELEILVSPGNRLDITGDLHIPWASITPGDVRTTIQPSPDEVLVGEVITAAAEDNGWDIYTRVRTSLGDDVSFGGYGLSGRIAGSLVIRDEPGALTRGTGELEILDGHYQAWRQRLQIERGRLFFSDTPVSDPALDIRAVRRPRGVVVGVNIRGTLREPELELFSDPPMQQSEQLSYLLTGQPLTEGREADMDLIREATLALQLAGGAAVGRSVGRRLGVDTVTIETGDTPDDAQVVFGEYLSPRLFISYGIGLFDSVNIFRIRYEISSRWFLEAQTGPRSGADFIYSLERG